MVHPGIPHISNGGNTQLCSVSLCLVIQFSFRSPVSTTLRRVSFGGCLIYIVSPGISTEPSRKEDYSEYLLKKNTNIQWWGWGRVTTKKKPSPTFSSQSRFSSLHISFLAESHQKLSLKPPTQEVSRYIGRVNSAHQAVDPRSVYEAARTWASSMPRPARWRATGHAQETTTPERPREPLGCRMAARWAGPWAWAAKCACACKRRPDGCAWLLLRGPCSPLAVAAGGRGAPAPLPRKGLHCGPCAGEDRAGEPVRRACGEAGNDGREELLAERLHCPRPPRKWPWQGSWPQVRSVLVLSTGYPAHPALPRPPSSPSYLGDLSYFWRGRKVTLARAWAKQIQNAHQIVSWPLAALCPQSNSVVSSSYFSGQSMISPLLFHDENLLVMIFNYSWKRSGDSRWTFLG